MKEECQINSGDFEDKLTTTLMRLFRAHFNITNIIVSQLIKLF